MATAFKIGDIVQLRSGGPKMTIVKIEIDEGIRTSWFTGSKMASGNFPIDAVILVNDKPTE